MNRSCRHRPRNSRAGYSLVSIFLLIALIAILLPGLVDSLRTQTNVARPLICFGIVVGTTAGAVMGSACFGTLQGCLGVALVGGVFGPMAMVLPLMPGSLPATAVSATLVIGFALVARKFSDRPP